MDLWTGDLQSAFLSALVAVLTVVVPFAAQWLRRYLLALETSALAKARETGGQLLYSVAEMAARWVEQTASQQATKWTGPEKLSRAVEFVQTQLPDVDKQTATAAVEAVLNAIDEGWTIPGPVAAIGEAYSAPTPAPVIVTELASIKQDVANAKAVADAARQEAANVGQTIQGLATTFGLNTSAGSTFGGVKAGGPDA